MLNPAFKSPMEKLLLLERRKDSPASVVVSVHITGAAVQFIEALLSGTIANVEVVSFKATALF
jgi:hypothetical protein